MSHPDTQEDRRNAGLASCLVAAQDLLQRLDAFLEREAADDCDLSQCGICLDIQGASWQTRLLVDILACQVPGGPRFAREAVAAPPAVTPPDRPRREQVPAPPEARLVLRLLAALRGAWEAASAVHRVPLAGPLFTIDGDDGVPWAMLRNSAAAMAYFLASEHSILANDMPPWWEAESEALTERVLEALGEEQGVPEPVAVVEAVG